MIAHRATLLAIKPLRYIFICAGLLAVAASGLIGGDAQAYSNQFVSPVPTDMVREGSTTPYGATAGNPSGTIRHVIKREGSSQINVFKSAAYFNNASTSHIIYISDRDTVSTPSEQRCHAYTNPSGTRVADFIRVTLSIDTGTPQSELNTIRYTIPSNRVCVTAPAGVNARGTSNASRNNSYFFRGFQVPSGFTQALTTVDEDTRLYKVNIRIEYNTPNVPITNSPSNNEKQQVTFKLRLSSAGCGAVATAGCTRYLSTVPVDSGAAEDKNYSTLGPNVRGYTYDTQAFRFGLPCTESRAGNYTVSLYDIDNQTTDWDGSGNRRDTYVIVQWSNPGGAWNSISTNDISRINGYSGMKTATGTRFYPSDGSGVSSRISLKMQPSINYRILVTPIHPRNLVGIGLPTETIFGEIDCRFQLTPNISVSNGLLAPGATVSNVLGRVANASTVTSFGKSSSAVVRFVLPRNSGTLVRGAAGTTTTSASNGYGCRIAGYVATGITNCRDLYTDSAGKSFPGSTNTTLYNGGDNLAGVSLSPGDNVCYLTVVNHYNQTAQPTDWRYSNTVCLVVVAQPKVHILGNDLRVGSSFSGGTNLNSSIAALVSPEEASWVEYAITAPSQVNLIASQSGAVNGSSSAQSTWSKLTFANTGAAIGCPGGYGCFNGASSLGKIPDVRSGVASIKTNGATLNHDLGSASISVSDLPSLISGLDLDNMSKSVSITTTGTITIDHDISYKSGTLNGEGDIPQLILVGGNINILAGVEHVDAWLIASDTVNTCSSYAQSALRDNRCDKSLVINGPVMASQLLLNRTHTTPDPDDAAETINLRGDAYIWANRTARQNGSWQTVYSTELPPRY